MDAIRPDDNHLLDVNLHRRIYFRNTACDRWLHGINIVHLDRLLRLTTEKGPGRAQEGPHTVDPCPDGMSELAAPFVGPRFFADPAGSGVIWGEKRGNWTLGPHP